MNGKISAGLLLVLLLMAFLAYFVPWRLPTEPPAVYAHVRAPYMASSATVEQIHPGRHRSEECFCPEVAFHVVIGLDAVRTVQGPPVASFRITKDGATEQIRIVRSSGSTKVDEDVTGQIARRRYAFPRDCGGWLVTVTPSIEFSDSWK
jgi:TonB-like protein